MVVRSRRDGGRTWPVGIGFEASVLCQGSARFLCLLSLYEMRKDDEGFARVGTALSGYALGRDQALNPAYESTMFFSRRTVSARIRILFRFFVSFASIYVST